MLPDDGCVAGFDNVSEGLDVSSSHLVLYQQAADLALDAAIATRPPDAENNFVLKPPGDSTTLPLCPSLSSAAVSAN